MSDGEEATAGRSSDRDWAELLRHNVGFDDPERWVEFARTHSFRRVRATRVEACPDCGGRPGRPLGAYVYYSTLLRLRPCPGCGLVFSDVRIDPQVLKDHFERSYKGEAYFSGMRLPIFESISREVAARVRHGGRVLDVGGAEGHLLACLREARPDLQLEVSDVSEEACRAARSRGLRAVRASVAELARRTDSFDALLLIDVAYYEPDVRTMWEAVARLVAPSGLLLLRVPNKLAWIRLAAGVRRALDRGWRDGLTTHVPFFNPEHVLAFSRPYLARRLAALGFSRVSFLPSPLLVRSPRVRSLLGGAYLAARAVGRLPGSPVCTPSLLVVAERSAAPP